MKSFAAISLTLLLLALIAGLPAAHYSLTSVETRNFRVVTPGVLYRSGQMTPAGLSRILDEYRIRTLISFRDSRDSTAPPPDEFETDLCQSKRVEYHRLAPQRWSAPDGTVPAKANVAKFLEIVRDPKTPRPILVHCFAGIHRTGAFVAIYRMECEGWSNDDAIQEMLRIGSIRSTFENDQLDYLANYRPNRK